MEEYILGFEVAMEYVVILHVLYCMAHLLDDASDFILWESALQPEVLVEGARRAQLHEKVEVCLVCEDGVELHDVGVVQEALDFYLADPLGEHFGVI